MTGRARCTVPFCGRTAPAAEGFVDGDFLCAGHWRLRSTALRVGWRRLRQLRRRSPGPWTEHKGAARLVRLALDREEDVWQRTRAYCIEIAMGL